VPGEETVLGREARDGEDLYRLAGEQWCQGFGGDARIAQRDRRQSDRLTVIVAKRAVRANELADTMSAREAVV
jgi:hypothetical protein